MTNGDRSLAEDLAQESFIRVFKAINRYQYPRPFKTWLYAISLNLVRDHYKQAEVRHSMVAPIEEIVFDNTTSISPAVEDRIQDRNEKVDLFLALSVLPIRQREVFILRYYEDLSLAEIADLLNIPVGTVKSRLNQGLHRLRHKMEDLQQVKERK